MYKQSVFLDMQVDEMGLNVFERKRKRKREREREVGEEGGL